MEKGAMRIEVTYLVLPSLLSMNSNGPPWDRLVFKPSTPDFDFLLSPRFFPPFFPSEQVPLNAERRAPCNRFVVAFPHVAQPFNPLNKKKQKMNF
jgi:hypothetical protein